MASFCIPKSKVDEFLKKLKSGEINPDKLIEMTSEERHSLFSSTLGEENARKVNALFESKLLLKNQQRGIINWAKKVTGIKPEVKRDMISKVERMTEILQPKDMDKFLSDLAEQRLGVGVTVEEAGKIADLAKEVAVAKESIKEGEIKASPESIKYAEALVAFNEYVKGLKVEAKALSLGELAKSPWQIVKKLSGGFKSAKASLDASFSTRQGFTALITKPEVWTEAFLKSFSAWKNDLQGIDGKAPLQIDVFSRPNFYNGKYKQIGLDIQLESEEAFPESWTAKIPYLGRLYKASMDAYNGALLVMRASLADVFIAEAESMGITNLKDSGIGRLVNSMTGRGRLPVSKGLADTLNATFFSPRYFKAQVDVLSAGLIDSKVRGTYAQKKAAQNLLRLIAVVGGILSIAKMLDPDSVELDSRSSKFGKVYVKVGDKRVGVDITAGFRIPIVLASRLLTPTMHNGEWGFWWQDSKGKYHNLRKRKYGELTAEDFMTSFLEGKLAPFARSVLNIYKKERWDKEEPTILREVTDLVSPISSFNAIETIKEAKDENLLMGLILSGLNMLGVSTTHDNKKRKGSKKTYK